MQIIQDRRALHQIPELQLCLPKTMAYLQQSLAPLKCKVFSPMESALCAFFDFGKADAIAFRADCDALPIQEQTGAPYASTIGGNMHACGHDGHMAIALELARRLNKKTDLPHNVLLVFQPGEEGPGGAKPLCETGVLEQYKVTAIFGLHLWPDLTPGTVFSRPGEMMTHSCEVTVDITGKSSHIARPQEGIDALAAGMEMYRRVRQLRDSIPAHINRILNFGLMQSGTVRNAISCSTHMEGSLRAYQEDVFQHLYDGVFSIAKDVEAETGCAVTVTMNDGHPAVINPPALYEKVSACVDVAYLETPYMTAEDFSWYQKRIPGQFFFLGIGNTPALHADNFCFDENILSKGADFFEKLAENFL